MYACVLLWLINLVKSNPTYNERDTDVFLLLFPVYRTSCDVVVFCR